MPEPVVNEPKVVSQPKVWSDAPIIEEYESDSEDEHVSLPTKEQETPSFAFINTVKHVKTPRQAVPTNAARKVNIVKPIVKNVGPKTGFHKTLSSFRKPFNRTTALRINFSKQKVNTAEVNAVSVVGGKRETAVKPSTDPLGRPKIIHKELYKTKSEKLAEEEATKAALSNEYDFIQARLNADKILAEKLQEEERNEMNEQVDDASKKRVEKDDSIKGEIKEEEGTRKRKLGIRKKMKSKKRKFTFKDDEELTLCLTIVSDEDKEVNYEILDKKDDICAIYQLVMNRYQDETPGGFDKIIWGDLIIMFNQSGNDEFWNAQQNWKIVSWKLHSSSGIHTIMTDEGIVIHMLVENKYPLKKEVLSQLIKLKLEAKEDNTMALELIRFVKKQIAELEPEDSDGDEKDL
ncbi:hypothetical protein Tco_0755842 [Tanacetum coccineum]